MVKCKKCGKEGVRKGNSTCWMCRRKGKPVETHEKKGGDLSGAIVDPKVTSEIPPSFSIEPVLVENNNFATETKEEEQEEKPKFPNELLKPLYIVANRFCAKYEVDPLTNEEIESHSTALAAVLDKYMPDIISKNSEVATLIFCTIALTAPRVIQYQQQEAKRQEEAMRRQAVEEIPQVVEDTRPVPTFSALRNAQAQGK